ncbi:MAG: HlyD family secretion protein [Pseudonocardiales bacterium]|jgi:HlyD family secretion protein|nr:HlyD family secretion protein [Pseudonocardiales bacterium]MDT7666893.1 HlyD family secretion protein [Pseudonocardiales bacterium]MDT7669166.1 HlyD family secretion protein [Pseudonocardiales bacterium]MDT7750370.1 HlyD family secretion protein [Pseudonocardiales bacterium]
MTRGPRRGIRTMHAPDHWQKVTGLAMSRAEELVATRRGRWLSAGAVMLPVALVVVACGTGVGSSPTTVRVTRGSVERTVAATGALQAITEQNLGFAKSGKLVELMVTVGQQVTAGQVLARMDDFEAQADLQEAQAKVARHQAHLDKIRDGNQVDAAGDDHDAARDVYDSTKDESDAIDGANSDSLDQAHQQLSDDQDSLKQAQQQVRYDQSKCNRSVTGGSHRYDGYGDNADVTSKNDKGLLLESPLNVHSPACERAERGKAAVVSYQRQIKRDRDQIQWAERRGDIDHAKQRVAEANARREAMAAKDAADGAESDRPHDIEEAEADVADAQVDVRRAQRSVDDTVLKAPVAGTVASINGTVGEYLGSATGTTPLAPGSRASLPDLDSGVGGKDSNGSKAQRPGGPSFLTLKDVNSFQVVAPYEESDAALIAPNQKVEVSFDAVPGLTEVGTVSSVAPAGTQIQDVTNYYVSVVLNGVDPRLKGGLTAETKVVVGNADNVLVVPTAAVQRGGQSGVVQVMQPDGTQRQVQVLLGMIGDTNTEIVEGLNEGQQVVIAQG